MNQMILRMLCLLGTISLGTTMIAAVPEGTEENLLSLWSFESSDATGGVTLDATGGPDGTPCLHVQYDGLEKWSLTSRLLPIPADSPAVATLSQARVKRGQLDISLSGYQGTKSMFRGRTAGYLIDEETTDWNQLLSSVTTTNCDSVRVSYSGKGPTTASVGLTSMVYGTSSLAATKTKVDGFADKRAPEILDRGLIALRTKNGVFLSWRFLSTDGNESAFNLYRCDDVETEFVKLNREPLATATHFLDTTVQSDRHPVWRLQLVRNGKEVGGVTNSARVTISPSNTNSNTTPHLRIPLEGNSDVSRVAFADLTGDGTFEVVVKRPNKNVDPYHKPNYWKPSEGTFTIEAYTLSGKRLWTYDLGWSIEQGIWYSPIVVYDFDGDGKAEVVLKTGVSDPRDTNGRVFSSDEFLTVLHGETGRPVAQVPWPAREGMSYNYASRNFLSVAYLDGKTPFIVALRGTYNLMRMTAWQLHSGRLEEKSCWSNLFDTSLWGQGAHNLHAADVTGDGREELCVGAFVLDADGQVLWRLGLGHPDQMYVGKLNPKLPGLQMYLGFESRNDKNGMCMVDAKTGKLLWGFDEKTYHIHSQGGCAHLDSRFPGCLCFGGESKNEVTDEKFLRTADGAMLARGPELGEKLRFLAGQTVWWDDTTDQVIVQGEKLIKLRYPEVNRLADTIQGNVIMVGDFLGDWREEIVTSRPGELRIYSTTIPVNKRHICLLEDRNYRATTVENTSGYIFSPRLSYDLPSQ